MAEQSNYRISISKQLQKYIPAIQHDSETTNRTYHDLDYFSGVEFSIVCVCVCEVASIGGPVKRDKHNLQILRSNHHLWLK